MIINNGPIGSGKFNPEKDLLIKFSLNDEYENIKFYENETDQHKEYYELRYQNENEINKWYIKFLKNCYIKLIRPLKCELFLVGKGKNGADGRADSYYTSNKTNQGGSGGDGGEIKILSNCHIKVNKYQITIEDNNSYINKINSSSILFSSQGGTDNQNNKGGVGAKLTSYGGTTSYCAQTDGTPAQGENGYLKYNIPYGAGGGGGACARFYNSGSNQITYTNPAFGGGAIDEAQNIYSGGAGGRVRGGDPIHYDGYNAMPNTGSGGGGGSSSTHDKGEGGEGSYGTIIISNYK